MLANHPALIDPILLYTHLYGAFEPVGLAEQQAIDLPVVRTLAARAGVHTIPEVATGGRSAVAAIRAGLAWCADRLRQGRTVIVHPAGRVYRSEREDLRGNRAAAELIAAVPECRVVLVRTRGLWGSGFSHARGQPDIADVLTRGAAGLLASGVMLAPRRRVTITLHEPTDLPHSAGRGELNRYLEAFYNAGDLRPVNVPLSAWSPRGPARACPSPAGR